MTLTATPPADSYVAKDMRHLTEETIPLELYLCTDCGHTQLGHVIDAEEVYLNYIYETASTLGLDKHFEQCADTVMEQFTPSKGGLVVDIGSNDGCLLECFKNYGMKVIGIDPMPGIAEKASERGIPTYSDFFTKDYAQHLVEKHGVATVVTSNNLVADTDDLTSFIEGVRLLMNQESIFFFETFYLYLQILNNVWDFTYHEHYSYFTVKPMVDYFDRLGMEIIDIAPNLTKGGSMRCTLQLKGGKRQVLPSVQEHISKETDMGFHIPGDNLVFKRYEDKISQGKREYMAMVETLKKENKTIVGYGASATSTTLMYHYEMDGTLQYLVDDFEAKHGLYSPGLHLPVFRSDELYLNPPDYVVILAWRYYQKIIDRHQRFLDLGGHFIVPLPELKVI